jgi:hypothetical protein
MVHWALHFFNDQLANHLQQGWLSLDDSIDGCSEDCGDTLQGFSGWKYFKNISIPSLPYNRKAYLTTHSLSIL